MFKKKSWTVVAHAFNSSTLEQKQLDFCEFKISLVTGQVPKLHRNPCLKNKTTKRQKINKNHTTENSDED